MIAAILLLIINTMILANMDTKKKVMAKPDMAAPGGWTVYGTMGCGWTRKQLDYMKEKNIPHTFVDCDKDDGSCSGMEAFPTLVDKDGVKTVGYKEV